MDSAARINKQIDIPYLGKGIVDWESDPLAAILIDQGKLKRSELNQIQAISQSRSESLGVALVKFGLLSENDLASTLSSITGLSPLDADSYEGIDAVPDQLPLRFLRSSQVVPVSWDEETMVLAMAEPRDLDTIRSISATVNLKISPALGLCSHIQNSIDHLATLSLKPVEEIDTTDEEEFDLHNEAYGDVSHLRELASEAPTIQTVNRILQQAIHSSASDIHFEPDSEGLRVRYRVDGVLRIGETLPTSISAAINSRIKIMAKLDIAEHRLPQDGRIQLKVTGKEINIRVSTVPVLHGESIVVRILDKSRVSYDYEYLGFDDDTLEKFQRILTASNGIFLVTGPTGCGKTTTLYTGLNQINSVEKKIITVEDPVEYQFDGINQIAVNSKTGLTFSTILKTILRQDPDIIMIGEMRDTETARIATQAALTGHLVLSTLHTTDAVTGITRLLDMGLENYLVTSTVNAVFAQRLVRKLCDNCRVPDPDQSGEFTPGGCEYCGNSGYEGRTVIYELFIVNDEIRDIILKGASTEALREKAGDSGMVSMMDCGMRLVSQGITTRAEVIRVAGAM